MPDKPPHLTLVGATASKRRPRSNSAGSRLWRNVLRERDFNIAQRELLKGACIAIDEADELRRHIEEEGEVFYKHGVPVKAHPAIKIDMGLRQFVAKSFAALGLLRDPAEKNPVGRPRRHLAFRLSS